MVAIEHSFWGLRMTLIRNQSIGRTHAATLARTQTGVRLYVTYYSFSSLQKTISVIPTVDHGEDHNAALFLDLNDESLAPEAWTMTGQYWTTKRREQNDDTSRGTWGRLEMRFKRRQTASMAVQQLCPMDREWLTNPPPHKRPPAQPVEVAP